MLPVFSPLLSPRTLHSLFVLLWRCCWCRCRWWWYCRRRWWPRCCTDKLLWCVVASSCGNVELCFCSFRSFRLHHKQIFLKVGGYRSWKTCARLLGLLSSVLLRRLQKALALWELWTDTSPGCEKNIPSAHAQPNQHCLVMSMFLSVQMLTVNVGRLYFRTHGNRSVTLKFPFEVTRFTGREYVVGIENILQMGVPVSHNIFKSRAHRRYRLALITRESASLLRPTRGCVARGVFEWEEFRLIPQHQHKDQSVCAQQMQCIETSIPACTNRSYRALNGGRPSRDKPWGHRGPPTKTRTQRSKQISAILPCSIVSSLTVLGSDSFELMKDEKAITK